MNYTSGSNQISAMTSDPHVFMAVGSHDGHPIWTSATGLTWTSAQVSGLSGGGTHMVSALVSSGSAVTGVGMTATQPAQQPVTVSLAAR
jgi:hypothetical protein